MHKTRNVVTVLVGIAATLWIASNVLQVLGMLSDVLAIFGFAWLLNLLLEPLVDWSSRWLARPYAWALGYLSVLLVITALAAPLAAQATSLPEALPGAIQTSTQQIDSLLSWLRARNVPVPFSVSRALEGGTLAQQVGPILLGGSLALLNTGGQFLLVICMAAAMSAGDASLRNLLLLAMPDTWLAQVEQIYDDVRRTYSAAIRGQLSVWGVGMALSFGTMATFGTPGILLWIGPIALVRLLPYLGGLLGGGLTIIIMLLTMPWPQVIIPVLVVFIIQNIVGYVLEPRVLGRALQLSPALVLFAVLVGWKLGGITGIVFGVPAVALVQTIAEHRMRRRTVIPAFIVPIAAGKTADTGVEKESSIPPSAPPSSHPIR